jgi:hypothetical protein
MTTVTRSRSDTLDRAVRRALVVKGVGALENGPVVEFRVPVNPLAPTMEEIRFMAPPPGWVPPPERPFEDYSVVEMFGGRPVYVGPSHDLPGRLANHLDPVCAGSDRPISEITGAGSFACFRCVSFDDLGIVLAERRKPPSAAEWTGDRVARVARSRVRAKMVEPEDRDLVELWLRGLTVKLTVADDPTFAPGVIRAAQQWLLEQDPGLFRSGWLREVFVEAAKKERANKLVAAGVAREVLNVWRFELRGPDTRLNRLRCWVAGLRSVDLSPPAPVGPVSGRAARVGPPPPPLPVNPDAGEALS